MIRKLLAYAVLLLGATSTSAYAADSFKLDMAISRNGIVVAKPVIQVEPEHNADLTVTPPGATKEEAIRVVVSVAKTSDKDTVGIHMMVFDRANGEWTLRAEPTTTGKLGKDIQLNVGANGLARVASPIDVTIKVAPGSPINGASTSSNWSNQLNIDLAAAPLQCNCCTAGNVQCCNVVSCCEGVSGACCSPPCGRIEGDRNLSRIEADRLSSPKERLATLTGGISLADHLGAVGFGTALRIT